MRYFVVAILALTAAHSVSAQTQPAGNFCSYNPMLGPLEAVDDIGRRCRPGDVIIFAANSQIVAASFCDYTKAVIISPNQGGAASCVMGPRRNRRE